MKINIKISGYVCMKYSFIIIIGYLLICDLFNPQPCPLVNVDGVHRYCNLSPDNVFLGSFNISFHASKEHILVNLHTRRCQPPAPKSFVSLASSCSCI